MAINQPKSSVSITMLNHSGRSLYGTATYGFYTYGGYRRPTTTSKSSVTISTTTKH